MIQESGELRRGHNVGEGIPIIIIKIKIVEFSPGKEHVRAYWASVLAVLEP